MENAFLSGLEKHWSLIFKKFSDVREMRNKLAHGTPITLSIRGKNHVRLDLHPLRSLV
jgi:hypothetical protein